jgi:alpha/beta superfamily hydrolase
MEDIEIRLKDRKLFVTLYDGNKDVCIIFCPPHPLYGGSRKDARLDGIAHKLSSNGIMVYSVDYHRYTGGLGEVEDILSVISYVKNLKGIHNIGILGYSYGAIIGSVVAAKVIPKGFVALSILKSTNGLEANLDSKCPKLLIHGKNDEIAPYSEFQKIYSKMNGKKDCLTLDTDHFYSGNVMDIVADSVLSFFSQNLFD